MTNRDTLNSPMQPMSGHPAATKRRLEDLAAPSALPCLGNLRQLDPKRLHAQKRGVGRSARPTPSGSAENAYW
jgi:hypothetical protein